MNIVHWFLRKKPTQKTLVTDNHTTEMATKNNKILKIYEGECPLDLTTIEYNTPTSNAHLKGFFIGANGGVKVTINDFYEPILEIDEEITPANVAKQKTKIRTIEKEARGNWLTVSFQKGDINPSDTIAIFAEFE